MIGPPRRHASRPARGNHGRDGGVVLGMNVPRVLAALLVLAFAGGAAVPRAFGAGDCTVPTFKYPHGVVTFTEHGTATQVRVEIADTEPSREVGLMCRRELDTDAGMLFKFEDLTQAPFWMKDTLIPLSIAFLDNRWRVVGILDMRVAPDPSNPPPTDLWQPTRPYRYALEVNQGFFKAHGLDAHAQVRFTPADPPKP